MAHQVEPMDIDSDSDNKENSLQHSNVLPFTEKGVEELDVSELNMKLRYSVTPASSPMSKSYTANCFENRSLESGDDCLNITVNENANLTRSLNSTMSQNDNVLRSLKELPLKIISTEQFIDNNRNASVLRPLESSALADNGNISMIVSPPIDIDENLSLPSSSSSALQTPEATTPTKDISLKDSGSPIMRGLKSVLSMFRSSQSPIPSTDNENTEKPTVLSPVYDQVSTQEVPSETVVASTPITARRKKEMSPTKRSSPQKDSSIVFNEDLERELEWKDETTIIFSHERIPIHKLMYQLPKDLKKMNKDSTEDARDLNSSLEYMDISNDSIGNQTLTDVQANARQAERTFANESDSEFVDCETTLTKNEGVQIKDDADKTFVLDTTVDLNIAQEIKNNNQSGSRLKPIILDTTQDILDATLTVKPEDLLCETLNQTKGVLPTLDREKTIDTSREECSTLQFDETVIQSDDPTFNVSPSEITNIPAENLDVTKTDEYFDVTKLLVTENFKTLANETVFLDEKKCNAQATPVVEHIDENPDIKLNQYEINNSRNVVELPVTLLSSLSNDIEKVKATAELPVNIPLPDEDDFDKESSMTEKISTKQPTLNLPLELEDDIKIRPENIEQKSESVDRTEMLTEETDKYGKFVPGIDNADLLETNRNINSQAPDGFIDQNIEKMIVADLLAKRDTINILPGDNTVYDDLVNECDNIKDTKVQEHIISSIHTEISGTRNVDVNNEIKTTSINENTCEIKSLPDIMHETITISNTDDLKSSVIVPVDTVMPILKTVDNISSYPCDLEGDTQVITKIESQISSVNISQPTMESSEIYKELPLNPDDSVLISENQPNKATTSCTFSNTISITESVINPIECTETQSITEDISIAIETLSMDMDGFGKEPESIKAENEIIISENNSPFTLVIADSNTDKNGETKTVEESSLNEIKLVVTPPDSPPIMSKGYSFNFDDIDFDPFATKTNIRMSPSFDLPKNSPDIKIHAKSVEKPIPKTDNRQQTQSKKKRPCAPKRKLTSTLATGKISGDKVKTCCNIVNAVPAVNTVVELPDTIDLNPNNVTIGEKIVSNVPAKTKDVHKEILKTESEIIIEDKNEQIILNECNESSVESNSNELKATSSSEQSTYYTASDNSIPSKNVFNLPEIHDINFNPFATKSMIGQSPPPSLKIDNRIATNRPDLCARNSSVIESVENEHKFISLEDKINTELMEKDASSDLSNTTLSSKATDEKNVTTTEINTEDEDTIEGPFLEIDDDGDKESVFDGDNSDMMQFNELPTDSNEETLDNGEMFIDAEAFEFLLNQNKTNTVVDSGKESLFLKFDPLFAKRMSAISSDGVVASLAKLQKKQSTPTKVAQSPPKNMSVTDPSNLNLTEDSEELNDDVNITISKPMMAVPPAVNPVTPRNKSLTPNRLNRRSITFTSPAMAVIDRLLSLSGNNSMLYDTTVTKVSREQSETDSALSQLREILAEKEISVYNLRSESNELRDRLNTLETHVKNLEAESQDRLNKINQLNDDLAKKTKINRSMEAVVEEYERTIARLIAETAQDKKKYAEEKIQLINERDEQTAHLASMEVSFNDLHSKYEKSKQIIFHCKTNEDKLKKSINELEENFTKMLNNYELLKQHATSKLNHANQELEKIHRSHEAEVLKLNAMIKRKELHITSLEESVNQKTKANKELTAICDELINKVG